MYADEICCAVVWTTSTRTSSESNKLLHFIRRIRLQLDKCAIMLRAYGIRYSVPASWKPATQLVFSVQFMHHSFASELLFAVQISAIEAPYLREPTVRVSIPGRHVLTMTIPYDWIGATKPPFPGICRLASKENSRKTFALHMIRFRLIVSKILCDNVRSYSLNSR